LKQLVGYITTGYPDKNFTADLALSLAQNGVDSIELGVPFSDPVADGPIIERANHKALELGFKFQDLLDVSSQVAKDVDILWMGYFNLFYQYNMDKLLPKAKELGVSGMIIPDLPHEEALRYKELFNNNDVANIAFVAPTDTNARIKEVVADAQKFIYLVAYAGITGSGNSEDLQGIITSIKEYTPTPIFVGFGVNEKTAKEKVEGADGVIVGSAFIQVLLDESLTKIQKIEKCSQIAKNIKDMINS